MGLAYTFFRVFGYVPNNLLAIKIKNLDRYMAKNWTSIEIQFKI